MRPEPLSTRSGSLEPEIDSFRHEALFYDGADGFVQSTGDFIRDGLESDEPILVVVGGHKIELLRSYLGRDAGRVRFADMNDVGRNPARIIPAWREFVAESASRSSRFRGVGEPIFPARTPSELVECERHEALLNLAFDGSPAWWLVCPYDTRALAPAVLEEAKRNHPFLTDSGTRFVSSTYAGLDRAAQPFDEPLPEPDVAFDELAFSLRDLDAVRGLVRARARSFGLAEDRVDDVVLAVDELATNSVRHGGGSGRVRVWGEGDTFLSEVADGGRIGDPLVGRVRPAIGEPGGLGLWLVTHLCDLVQVRTHASGSVVRVHMRRA